MSSSEIAAAPVSRTGPRVIQNQTPERGIFINFPDRYLKSRLYWMPLKKKATILSLYFDPPPPSFFHSRRMPGPLKLLYKQSLKENSQADVLLSGKGLVHVWNLNTRRAESVLDGHAGASVIWLSTVRSTNTFLSQGRDMQVCVWDLHEGRRTAANTLPTGSVGFCQCCLLESEGNKTLIALPAENMEEIKVMELASQRPVCSLLPDHKHGMLMCMKMWQTDAGPLLCAGYEDGSLVIWDVSCRRPVSCLNVHPEPVMSLDFDSSRQKGISGSSDKNLCSWRLDEQQKLEIQDSVPIRNPGVSHLRIRSDRKIVATAGWDGSVRIFSWKKLKPLAVLHHHKDLVHSVDFSDHPEPSKRLMAAGSKDQRISLWSIYTES
ncbi:Guanine nucleotide-binding protein subunit beta-like protein 1 [Bagarius yarrelli]|uniref:Guanine nucleotide-binding protein subunit beta-like protein 1 n=1 Tax=Bagarius yarrelli TaxID=175774 RepID=A0A556VBP7_BAGYA|nr:Guanine nucleotide-binding protein subunit beta-like protein 1 [Bagarius yarrelli]